MCYFDDGRDVTCEAFPPSEHEWINEEAHVFYSPAHVRCVVFCCGRNNTSELMADLVIFVCWFLSIVTIINAAPRVCQRLHGLRVAGAHARVCVCVCARFVFVCRHFYFLFKSNEKIYRSVSTSDAFRLSFRSVFYFFFGFCFRFFFFSKLLSFQGDVS